MGQSPRRKGARAAFAVGLSAALLAAPTTAQEGLQDGLIAFEDLSSSALLELYADVGEVLKRRALVPTEWNPPQVYAERLAMKALSLTDAADGYAKGPDGRYRIVGQRVADESTPVRIEGLGADFDQLAVVLFQQDFQVMAAAVFPKEVIAPKLENGAVTLSKDVLTAPGVRSVTAKIYRHVNDDFQ